MLRTCFTLNHTYNFTVNNVPSTTATGSTCDISPLLRFSFYQPVYCKRDDSSFPSDATEEHGRFAGILENAGNDMTFEILTSNTNIVSHHSNGRSVDNPVSVNLRAEPLAAPKVVKSLSDDVDNPTFEEPPLIKEDSASPLPLPPLCHSTPIINPSDLVGRSFLCIEGDGQRLRVKIVKAIETHEDELDKNSACREFICSTDDDQVEEIFTCNEIIKLIEDQQDEDAVEWRFKCMTAHEGPLL